MNLQHKSERLLVADEFISVAPYLDLNSIKTLFPTTTEYKFAALPREEDYKGRDGALIDHEKMLMGQYKSRTAAQGADIGKECVRIYLVENEGKIKHIIHDSGRDLHAIPQNISTINRNGFYVVDRDWRFTEIKNDFVLLRNVKSEFYWFKTQSIERYSKLVMQRWFEALEDPDHRFRLENFIKSKRMPLYAYDDNFDIGCDVKVVQDKDTKWVTIGETRFLAKICKIICYIPATNFTEGQDFVRCPQKDRS